MAQTMLLNPFSQFVLPPRNCNRVFSYSNKSTIVALFKSKPKVPPKKLATPVKKEKPKVEDGIFGTSGGIGFTKQNELFVGRVAMIGFAASLLGEAITGKGILSQLNLETGIPIYEAEPLLLFFILFNLLGAIGALGDRGRFVDDSTGLEKAVIAPGKGFRSALGLGEGGPLFGFTKANELFVGRLAQLGIAFSIIGEIVTGKGALAQLNIETGVPINEIEPLLLFNVAFFFFAAINPGTGKFVTDDEED
ncbi:photosystem II 22 kDa protein [Striga asiatica]|uniref:Photosystem II 22 kDa protein, chloroplastic n=1 Tax=Striga asiatica TaxID=4170 RepID=A0A5A7Q0R5_STRAF|nr:photosystem II 22 kDa protein [Striga asiatica]